MRHLIIPLLIIVLMIGCSRPTTTTALIDGVESTIYRPPGTIEVDRNIYVDESELSNMGYREYLSWLETVHGKASLAYQKAYPDVTVWQSATGFLKDFDKDYFINPVYGEFPVVGISLEQAKAYSKWRTDRVAEMILAREQYIKLPEVLSATNHFTIEKYISGNYKGVLKKERKRVLPVYYIPTKMEWERYVCTDLRQLILADKERKYNQKLIKNGRPLYNLKQDKKAKEMGPMFRFGYGESQNGLKHVIGNVSEMTLSGESRGGNWQQSLSELLKNDEQLFTTPNHYTGFRNICRWEKLGAS
ncbi:MAG: SUMF1/EgtB/PvdO family nonheme iron enzyme [Bacteroidota bacterium]